MKIIPSSRKHCYAARIGVLLVTAVLIAGVGGAYYVGSDDNTPAQNLEIRTWYDLDAIRDNLSGNHTLMNDLDSNTLGYEELASPTANQGKGWEPIGFFGTSPLPDVGCSGAVPPPAVWCFGLTGTFDGQEYEIRDLYIDRPDDCYQCPIGLFTCINEGGIIKNVGVVNITMTGCGAVGGLVGENWHGTVSNSYSTGSVSGNENVGGLVGLNRRTISNSYSTGSVTGDVKVGGLVGENFGNVNDSYSTGSVTGAKYIGGLVGDTISNLTNCYATGSVTGNDNVGGLIGYNGGGSGIVNNSYSTGSVSGNENVGGLVGSNSGTISNSYSTGSVTGNRGVGGLMGSNAYGTVINSYATGSATGDDGIGGLLGYNAYNSTVTNSYSAGDVTGDVNVGGLVGFSDDASTVSNSFWDIETSGQATSDGGVRRTTAQMKSRTTFSGAGWSIIAVANPSTRNPAYTWNIVDAETYPFLSWQS